LAALLVLVLLHLYEITSMLLAANNHNPNIS
jgi:hypothetical protein